MNILEIAGFLFFALIGVFAIFVLLGGVKWSATFGEGKDAKKFGNLKD